LVKAIRVDPSTLDAEFTESAFSKDSYSNNAAYGPPDWLRPESYTIPFSLGPGGVLEVSIQVIGPLVTRGPHRCYWTIDSNDDYYLNGAKQHPYVQLGVLGGCLESEDALIFGTSEQNITPVLNTGEFLYAGVDPPIEIDGDDAPYFQGMLVIATEPLGGPADPPFRQAWTSDDWQGGPHDFWNSLLPDVNCFNQCEPYVTSSPIILCQMWDDGVDDYADVMGYAAAYAYIDSVQDFDCYATGWDWSNTNCPFDNSLTMGLRVDEYMYGVIEQPSLNNVIIFKHVITNRNSVPVDNVFFGTFDDFDLESNTSDYWYFDNDHAIAWGASTLAPDPNNTKVYGRGVIPMGADCDGGMIGVRTLDAQQALWHNDNIGLDSMYYWCQQPGATYQIGVTPMDASDDRDAWMSLTGHNFAADETWDFGHYFFGYEHEDPFVTATWTGLAAHVNEFCGFVRGKIDNDDDVDLADAVALWNYLHKGDPATYPGPPFKHSGDVNCDDLVNDADVLYIVLYHFCLGPPPCCAWSLPDICP
jgi:hypothetical protein